MAIAKHTWCPSVLYMPHTWYFLFACRVHQMVRMKNDNSLGLADQRNSSDVLQAWPECGTWSNIGCFRPMFRPDSHSIDYSNAHKSRWDKFVCCLISDIPLQLSSLRRNLLGIGRKKHAGTLSSRMVRVLNGDSLKTFLDGERQALWHSRTWSVTHHGLNFPSTISNYSIKYCGTKCITAFLGLRCRSSLVRSPVTPLPSIYATTVHYSQSFTVILLSLRLHITQELLMSGSESRQAVFPAEFLRNRSNVTVLCWKSRDRHRRWCQALGTNMNMSVFCPLILGTWAGTLLLDMVTQYDIAGCAAEPSGF